MSHLEYNMGLLGEAGLEPASSEISAWCFTTRPWIRSTFTSRTTFRMTFVQNLWGGGGVDIHVYVNVHVYQSDLL